MKLSWNANRNSISLSTTWGYPWENAYLSPFLFAKYATSQHREDLHDERPRFIIKGVTPRIPCGLPSRWSPTRGSNQAELIMQRLCYSLHRSINGTRIHVQIIFGTTNCHSGLPSSSVVIVLLCAMYRAKVDVLCDSRLSNLVVVFCCFFVWKREWRRANYYDWIEMKCQAWRWFFLRKHNLWLGFMFRTRGGDWVVYLRWWWWWL